MQVPFVPHSWLLLKPLPPMLPCHITRQAGPIWSLIVNWELSYSGMATLRGLGCFWYTAWISTHDSHCYSTETLPKDLITSVSHGWVFSLVVAAPDSVLHCYMEWVGLCPVLGPEGWLPPPLSWWCLQGACAILCFCSRPTDFVKSSAKVAVGFSHLCVSFI